MVSISVITLFPELISTLLDFGIMKRYVNKVKMNLVNLRDFGVGDRNNVDGYVVGHGCGMVLRADVLLSALSSLSPSYSESHVVHMSPRGNCLTQSKVLDLAKKKHLIIIASRYEGLDQRFVDKYVNEEISIGDYILSGGDVPTLVLLESILRVSGCLKDDAFKEESFSDGLLEYNQYTKPLVFEGMKFPDYLVSGNHKVIAEIRYLDQLLITCVNRLTLFRDYPICSLECSHKDPLVRIKRKNALLQQRLRSFEQVLREHRDGKRKTS